MTRVAEERLEFLLAAPRASSRTPLSCSPNFHGAS